MFEKSTAILVLCNEEFEKPSRSVAEAFLGSDVEMLQLDDGRQLLFAHSPASSAPLNEEATGILNKESRNALTFVYGNAIMLEEEARWSDENY
jgi:hypothetical protein